MSYDPDAFIYGIQRKYNLNLDGEESIHLQMVLEEWLNGFDKKKPEPNDFDKEHKETIERIWQRLVNHVCFLTHGKN